MANQEIPEYLKEYYATYHEYHQSNGWERDHECATCYPPKADAIVPFVDVSHETAYGSTVKFSNQIRVF